MRPSELLAQKVIPISPVALDTETSGLFVDDGARAAVVSIAYIPAEGEDMVALAWPFDQGVQMTGKPEDTGQLDLWTENPNLPKEEWLALVEWLKLVGERVGFVFHHAKFDLHIMAAGVRQWPGLGVDLSHWTKWDTQNVCHLIWPKAKTTSLKPTAARLWGVDETNESEMVKEYLRKAKLPAGRWDLVPWELIGPYAAQDARLTLRLYYRQLEEMDSDFPQWFKQEKGHLSLQEAIQRRLDTSLMLFRIERRGLPFDSITALASAEVLADRQVKFESDLPFSPATLPMAKHYWFGSGLKNGVSGLGLNPYSLTTSGKAQLNAQIVDKMVADKVPHADTWRNLQKLITADSRWYTGWASKVGADGRLRASVRQNGTVSARFSVERVQLQAIPHDYKLTGYEALDGVMTPRQLIGRGVPEGYQLWELDLAQAELRVAALYAGCTRMLKLIHEDQDLHGDAATQLFGVTIDSPDWGEMRNVAKRANFSLIFGVGAEKLQEDIETQTGIAMPLGEVQRIVREWNGLYPEYQQAVRQHMRLVEDRMNSRNNAGLGYIETTNGERRWFQPDEETHKAFNQRVQPNLAQFGLDWWLMVEQILVDELGDDEIFDEYSLENIGRIGMVMTIHDSMVLLLPDDESGESLAEMAKEIGVGLWSERFPGVPGDVDVKPWGS